MLGDGHSSRTAVTGRLERPTRAAARKPAGPRPEGRGRAAPTWSCSRWGLPCRRRYRRRGALLPHPFTLTRHPRGDPAGGLLSVALSLGLLPPGITRHRVSVEPGLSSPGGRAPGGGHPAIWRRHIGGSRAGGRQGSRLSRVCTNWTDSASAMPSIRSRRKCRWKARTTACVAGPKPPSTCRA